MGATVDGAGKFSAHRRGVFQLGDGPSYTAHFERMLDATTRGKAETEMFKRVVKGAVAAVVLSVAVLGWTGVAQADHEKDCKVTQFKDGQKTYGCKVYDNHG